ncbi:hypothetical protein NQ318_019413 [Aromia moschata]|uniref:Uncharacterized protein n=1 Tax=Aromia moschata TaxID=1265417 RepID=A0AAV8XJU9_9CUCU|nr:hypothetical protein NQ318_019413 [Aromia moschata]
MAGKNNCVTANALLGDNFDMLIYPLSLQRMRDWYPSNTRFVTSPRTLWTLCVQQDLCFMGLESTILYEAVANSGVEPVNGKDEPSRLCPKLNVKSLN